MPDGTLKEVYESPDWGKVFQFLCSIDLVKNIAQVKEYKNEEGEAIFRIEVREPNSEKGVTVPVTTVSALLPERAGI